MSKRFIRFDVIALIAVSIAFLSYPQLDLVISSWWYNAEDGFHLSRTFFPRLILVGIVYLAMFFIVSITALSVAAYLFRGTRLYQYRVRLLFLFLAMMIGPTLIVNTVIKDNSGRARPSQIEYFGGKALYSPPLKIADQCDANCSFVSGHAAAGFFFICFGFLTTRYRRYWILFGITFGLVVGLGRMMSGSHFLSDIIYSGFVCWFSILGVYHLMRKRIEREQKAYEIRS